MSNLFSRAIGHISVVLKEFQVKRFLAVVLVGFLVLTTNVDSGRNSQGLTQRINEVVHQDGSDRPKTIGEWNREASATQGDTGERLQRIGKESAEAVKDFGEVYPDTAEKSARDLDKSSGERQHSL